MDNDLIVTLYSKPQTVFSLREIALYVPKIPYENLRSRLRNFTNVGKLKRLHRGIYAKNEYNPLELANKLYKPSYISLEYVLARGGVTFQYYERIFAVSHITREVQVGEQIIQYRQIRKDILINMQGIEQIDNYFIASLERAFLDAVYIYKDYHFDNLGTLNWEKIFALQPIYHNTEFDKRVKSYYKDYKEDYAK